MFLKNELRRWILSAILSPLLLFIVYYVVPNGRAMDFFQFWVVGQAVKHLDITDVYSSGDMQKINQAYKEISTQPEERFMYQAVSYRRNLRLAGTPFLYSVFGAFSSGKYDKDYNRFRLVSWLLFSVSILWLLIKLKYPPLMWPVMILGVSVGFWPLRVDVASANVNQLQVFQLILGVSLLMTSSRLACFLAGTVFSLAIFFKPTFIYFVIPLCLWIFLSRSAWMSALHLGGYVAGAIVGYALPERLFGTTVPWSSWIVSAPEMLSSWNYLRISGPSYVLGQINMGIYRLIGFCAMMAFCATIFAIWVRSKSIGIQKDATSFLDMGILFTSVAVYVLTGPLIHGHYFLLIVPLIVYLGGSSVTLRNERPPTVLLLILSWAMFNAYPVMRWAGFDVKRDLTGWSYIATALLLVLGIVRIKQALLTTRTV